MSENKHISVLKTEWF